MSVIKIILYRALQEAEVGRSVLYLAGPLVCLDFSLASSFHVPAPEDFISLPLADKLRVVTVHFQHPDNPCGKVVQERVVWNQVIHKLKQFHIRMILIPYKIRLTVIVCFSLSVLVLNWRL